MSVPVVVDVLALPVPDGSRARRTWLRVVGPAEVRIRCGISRAAVARALGVSETAVWGWETGRRAPLAAKGTAYLRVIAGLARHLEVPESRDDDTDEPLLGDEKGSPVTLWNTPPEHLAGDSPLVRAATAFMKATQELDLTTADAGWSGDAAVRRRLDAYAAARELAEAVRDAGRAAAAPATAEASHWRNARKLAIALDALREIRDGKTSGEFARECVGEALNRIAALGPSLADLLPGDGDEEDDEFMRDAASLDDLPSFAEAPFGTVPGDYDDKAGL